MKDLDDLALELGTFLERERALAHDEIEGYLEVSPRVADEIVRHYRLTLSYPDHALVAKPIGGRQWVYVISGDPAEIRGWVAWSLRHVDARLETVRSQAEVAVQITDGRTVEGRRARLILRSVTRLAEDLSDLVPVQLTLGPAK